MMRSIMWVPAIMSLLAAVTVAQKECTIDNDCMNNQFCYTVSQICVNYTICSRYYREEGLKPSREPSQCGDCLEGYAAEAPPESNIPASELCRESEPDPNAPGHKKQTNSTETWVIWGSILIAIVFIIGFLYVVYALLRCKSPCKDVPATEPERPCSLLMVEHSHHASAPPPSPSQSRNNNKYDDAEETNPLSSNREYCNKIKYEDTRPVKAQGYHPPNYVSRDLSYNPGDTQTGLPIFSPPDIEEETIPSEWTPGPSSGVSLPEQPFAAIAEEVRDNNENTALQRITCPSPSTSQEGDGNRQENGSPGNSRGFGYNNTGGNARGTSNTPTYLQVFQTVHIVHQGSSGS